MKRLSKIIAVMCSFLILLSVGSLYVEAATLSVGVTSKISASSTANKVTLSWKSVSKATGYRVYQQVDGKWKKLKTLTDTNYAIKNLIASEEYRFAVKAYRKANGKTIWSNNYKTVKVKTKNMGSTPTPTATAKENSVTLKWKAVAGASGYRVYQYKNGEWIKIKSVTTNTYTINSLKSFTTYKFRIKPYAKTQKKVYWAEASKTCTVKTRGKEVVLVNELDFGDSFGKEQTKNSVKFQSLFDFVNGELDVHRESMNSLKYSQKFSGSKEDAEIIEEYVELLDSSKNLTECDPYYADYGTQIFASWGFVYNGDKKVENNCESNFSSKKVPCAVSVYYKINRNSMEGYLCWSANLQQEDLGFRTGGETESLAPAGESAGAGLIRRASGKYETSDGRFSVNLNQAAMIVNGETAEKCTLEYEDTNVSDLLKIKDSSGMVVLRLFFSQITEHRTGLIYERDDVSVPNQYSGTPTGLKSDIPQIYQLIGNTWLTPTYTNSPYSDVTIRVVYYDKKEEVAVFYIYTEIIDETEFFCAVDLSKAIDKTNTSGGGGGSTVTPGLPSGSSTPCGVCNSSGRCSKCNGNRYLYSSASGRYDLICSGCTATGRCIYCGGDGRL